MFFRPEPGHVQKVPDTLKIYKIKNELDLYHLAYSLRDLEKARTHLGRAHILSQASAIQHLRIHCLMLLYALKTHDLKEVFGQIIRLLVTIPGHILGKVPQGNIGWSTVGLTEKMEVPEDLK